MPRLRGLGSKFLRMTNVIANWPQKAALQQYVNDTQCAAEYCVEDATQRITRFNSGKDLIALQPKYKAPKAAKQVIKQLCEYQLHAERMAIINDLKQWAKDNLKKVVVGKFIAKRLILHNDMDNTEVILNKTFFGECISKYKKDPLYIPKLIIATNVRELFKIANFIRVETETKHLSTSFRVYETNYAGLRVQFKVKCNPDADILYIMRLFKD